jgi:hypothetical protein
LFKTLRQRVIDLFERTAQIAWNGVRGALAPASNHGRVTGLLLDVTRSRRELIAENALTSRPVLGGLHHDWYEVAYWSSTDVSQPLGGDGRPRLSSPSGTFRSQRSSIERRAV